jgi:hypothetical protein
MVRVSTGCLNVTHQDIKRTLSASPSIFDSVASNACAELNENKNGNGNGRKDVPNAYCMYLRVYLSYDPVFEVLYFCINP